MSNKTCPCIKCVPPKRNPGCHGVCPEYKAWNEEHIAHKRIVSAMKVCEAICDNYEIATTRKNMGFRHSVEKYR